MSTTKDLLGPAIAAIIACNLPVSAAQGLSAQDRMFIEDTVKGALHEAHMGRLGIEHGQSDDVKGLSQRLINDHNKASQELETLAKQKGVMLPGDNAKLISSMPLAQKTGSEFDTAFAKMIVEDHRKDIAAFEKEISSGADPELKSWASKTLPTIRKHLAEAQDIVKAESQTVAK